MKKFLTLTAAPALFALTALGAEPVEKIKELTDAETSAISAVMVSNVQDATASHGEVDANVSVITVFTGPMVAPFTTYLKVFDPIPQNGGDYGTFKVFQAPKMLNAFPKRLKVQYARDGKAIYVGFDAPYFVEFAENGDPKYGTGRMITKFSIATPFSEGALAPNAEFSIRD